MICFKCNNKIKINNKSGLCKDHYKSEADKRYRLMNKDYINASIASYKKKHPDKVKETAKRCYAARSHKEIEYKKKYEQDRKKTDLLFKLKRNLRTRLWHATKYNWKLGSAVSDLGCSIEEFKIYIESLFIDDMSWDNWSRTGWHIDHIKPLSSFNLSDKEDLLKACHYSNLQPLWCKDNLSKGCKV